MTRIRTFVPSLAESYDALNDGQSFVFHLRPGVKWHDGTPLTVADVKYSFDRVADPSVGVYFADLLSDVSEVTIIDESTVQVDLKEVSVAFLDALISEMELIFSDAQSNESGKSHTTNYKWNQQKITLLLK